MWLFRGIDGLMERFERFAIAGSIILMALVCIVNVLCRNLINYSLSYAEEVCQFAIVWVTFMGASYAARHGVHIRMSALYDMMPPAFRKIMMVIMSLGTGLLMFLLAWYAYRYVGKMAVSGRVSPALRIPMWWIMVWVPLGFICTGVQYMITFLKNLSSSDIWVAPAVKDGENDENNDYAL